MLEEEQARRPLENQKQQQRQRTTHSSTRQPWPRRRHRPAGGSTCRVRTNILPPKWSNTTHDTNHRRTQGSDFISNNDTTQQVQGLRDTEESARWRADWSSNTSRRAWTGVGPRRTSSTTPSTDKLDSALEMMNVARGGRR